jgi:hypothetical protein
MNSGRTLVNPGRPVIDLYERLKFLGVVVFLVLGDMFLQSMRLWTNCLQKNEHKMIEESTLSETLHSIPGGPILHMNFTELLKNTTYFMHAVS